jgi:hypoxanthine phosphoribosyltransferase
MQIAKQLGHQKFRLLFHNDEIKLRIKNLAIQMNKDFEGSKKPLVVIGVLKGSFIFVADLVRELTIPLQVEFITASSYLKTKSSGNLHITEASLPNLKDKHVLIVEDIIDSGLTIKALTAYIENKKPSSLKICSLFIKPDMIKEPIPKIDYIGFSLSDAFIIGYGLDYEQNYRELPHVIELLDVEV